jgi:glycosyltransferase involved in cell wall biosynthesis
VPSRGLARELESTFPTLTKNKIHVIPNPVDTRHFLRPAEFHLTAMRNRLAIPDDGFVLSFCALASFTSKGLRIVFEALAQISDSRIHLIVIGGHVGEIGEYSKLAQSFQLTHQIHFVGLQTDIRPYLWSSQAFVFPSAYETFSLVCFQAAAAGLPIIATCVYGLEDFLVNGANGFLVERTIESVASAIRDVTASPEKAAAMGQKAQRDIAAYDTAIFQCRWLELLDEKFGIRAVDEIQFAHN